MMYIIQLLINKSCWYTFFSIKAVFKYFMQLSFFSCSGVSPPKSINNMAKVACICCFVCYQQFAYGFLYSVKMNKCFGYSTLPRKKPKFWVIFATANPLFIVASFATLIFLLLTIICLIFPFSTITSSLNTIGYSASWLRSCLIYLIFLPISIIMAMYI